MATKKATTGKSGKLKVGKLKVQTTKVKAKDLKKVKGGATDAKYDWAKNVKV